MPMLPPQPVSLTCPNCGTPFQAPVFQLIDVGLAPELKQALLSGRVNVAVCPKCGAGGMLASPLVYHDPAKQFFFALFPPEVQATPQEQEQFIGAFSQFILRDLPPDAPRGYLLTPRRFISLSSMLDTILEGEGIPRAALEAQRKRTELLGRLLATEDEQALQRLVDENRDALDYEFFLTLSAYVEASEQEQDAESLRRFGELRERLMTMTGFTMEDGGAEPEQDLDETIDALLQVEEAKLPEAIADHRPQLDYDFYAALSERIDTAQASGDSAEAERLAERRDLIRDTAERMDRDAQELFDRAARTLQAVLEAPDARAALVEHRDELDEAFMLVAGANAQQAARTGDQELLQRLNDIQQSAMEVVQEALSPEERLIGQLLSAEKPQDATRLLRQNAATITGDFVKRLNELATEMETAGRKDVSERLRQLGREAASMLF